MSITNIDIDTDLLVRAIDSQMPAGLPELYPAQQVRMSVALRVFADVLPELASEMPVRDVAEFIRQMCGWVTYGSSFNDKIALSGWLEDIADLTDEEVRL